MPKPVLTRRRSWIARFAVLAIVFSLLAVALPASAHSVALSTATPCPSTTASAGFTDIGGFDATTQLAINCLFAFGITTGTSATTYSPNDTTTRWQMALFLVRQAADHGITIPAATSQGYTDIGGLPQSTQDAINQITQLGISKGTSTTTFSPNLGVSRWQMALFIYRTGLAAGVTFASTAGHNDFTDIGGQLAEAQTAINALADTRVDPEGHIALGTGGSLFTPDILLARWQMALFLTRLLAADNIAAPAGTRVTVAPTALATQGTGTARTYTATFKNADASAYTGRFGIQLVEASSGAPVYNDVADFVVIESITDGASFGTATSTGVVGTDGTVTFTIRHAGTGEDTIPVAWEDLDLDGTYETAGNVAPTEPFGLGGVTDFVAGPAAEAPAGAMTVTVTKTTKASDVFEGTGAPCLLVGGCSFFYDSGDIFSIVGTGAVSLQDFEDVLSIGDTLTGTYDPDAADQSTFTLTDNVTPVAVTDPSGPTTADAAAYAIKGTGDPGATIRIRQDLAPAGPPRGAEDGIVATGTVDVDGNWTVSTPLAQGVANDFLASQIPVGGSEDPSVDVPTITEGAAASPDLLSVTPTNGGVVAVLDGGDTLTLDFAVDMSGAFAGDTIQVTDGTDTATLSHGGNATFSLVGGNIVITINSPLGVTISGPSALNNPVGFQSGTGVAVTAAAFNVDVNRNFVPA